MFDQLLTILFGEGYTFDLHFICNLFMFLIILFFCIRIGSFFIRGSR